jgi:hypothetical protein
VGFAGVFAASCGRIGFDASSASSDAHDAPGGGPFPLHWQNRNDGTPGPLFGAGMTFDVTRGTMLLYGGASSTPSPPASASAAMWELKASGWTSLCNPCTPGPRYGPGFAYDPLRDRVVLYGGVDAIGTTQTDTWEWNGTAWLSVTVTGSPPGPRAFSQLVFDPSRAALVLLGGNDGAGAVTDVHTYSNGAWTLLTAPNGPAIAGQSTEAAYDGSRIVVVEDDQNVRDTLWSLTANTWSKLCSTCSGIPRWNASIVYHPRIAKLLLMGGYADPNEIAGTWSWSGSRWEMVAADPPRRDSTAVAYDPTRDVVVLYGGNGDSCTGSFMDCDETWELLPN